MSSGKAHRQSFTDRLITFTLNVIRKTGIDIQLFYTVREGESDIQIERADDTLWLGFLGAEDAGQITAMKRGGSPEKIPGWFAMGRLCFGVKEGGRVVASMWCNLAEFHFPPPSRELQQDEVYFYAAAVSDAYRGRNIALMMRVACYNALREKGRTRFYSYTDYFNKPALRFKQKLGARNERLRFHVNLFNLWKKTWTVKAYS